MLQGDERAFREFYDDYFPRLLRYMLVVTRGDEDQARDALQATLVRVAKHIKIMPDEASLWNWLTVLARSSLIDQGRKRHRYLAFLDRFTLHREVVPPKPTTNDAEARLSELLERGLALLGEEERDLIERKYFADESLREIAAAVQSSEKAVESRLARIRRKLKEVLLSELKE